MSLYQLRYIGLIGIARRQRLVLVLHENAQLVIRYGFFVRNGRRWGGLQQGRGHGGRDRFNGLLCFGAGAEKNG